MSETPPANRANHSPQRNPPLALGVVAFALLAVMAVVSALLLPGQGAPHTARPLPNATATTLAAHRAFNATGTAQALQFIQPYAPAGIGPCDTADPPYSSENNSYWQWTQGPFTCDVGGVVEITGEGYITFYGFPNGFPRNFQTSFTVTFHSPKPTAGPLCLTYGMNGATQGPTFCDDGTWSSPSFYTPSGTFARASSYHFVMYVYEGIATFSVNGKGLGLGEHEESLTDISFYSVAVPPGARIAVAGFTLVPTT